MEQLDPGLLFFHNTFVGEAPNSMGQGLPTKASYNMGECSWACKPAQQICSKDKPEL